MNLEDLKSKGLFIPPVEKKYLELPEPTNADNLADTSRLVGFLRLKHDEHRLVVRLPVIRKIPGILREAGFKVTVTLDRPVFDSGKSHIINIEPGDTTGKNFAIAVDIGTTTIYGQLIDLITGDVLAEHGDFNGQISYGEDIISRIIYAERPGGLDTLHEVVVADHQQDNRPIYCRISHGRSPASLDDYFCRQYHDVTDPSENRPQLYQAIPLRAGGHYLSGRTGRRSGDRPG